MYKIKILTIFVLILICITNVYGLDNNLKNKIIYLDAGHGGVDPGSVYKDIYEKDINLEIVLLLKESLEKEGAIVYLTRDKDKDLSTTNIRRKKSDLSNRAYLINKTNPDIYLSIHLNSSNHTSYNGAQVFYDNINKNNKSIAEIFQKYFNKELNSDKEATENKNLYMYKNIYSKGVLLELGFLSNSEEREKLLNKDYKLHIVDTIKSALIEIFNNKCYNENR